MKSKDMIPMLKVHDFIMLEIDRVHDNLIFTLKPALGVKAIPEIFVVSCRLDANDIQNTFTNAMSNLINKMDICDIVKPIQDSIKDG